MPDEPIDASQFNLRYTTFHVPHDTAELVPIADAHVGDGAADERILRAEVEYIAAEPNRVCILAGDMINWATRTSKSDPTRQKYTNEQQYDLIKKILDPIRPRIIGAVVGNHEDRPTDNGGLNMTYHYCGLVGIPYLAYAGMIRLGVGTKTAGNPRQTYYIGIHHTTGGGATPAAKLTSVNKLALIMPNCDLFLGAHRHGYAANDDHVYLPPGQKGGELRTLRRDYVSLPTPMDWRKSYAVKKQYAPTPFSKLRITFHGETHHPRDHRVDTHKYAV